MSGGRTFHNNNNNTDSVEGAETRYTRTLFTHCIRGREVVIHCHWALTRHWHCTASELEIVADVADASTTGSTERALRPIDRLTAFCC